MRRLYFRWMNRKLVEVGDTLEYFAVTYLVVGKRCNELICQSMWYGDGDIVHVPYNEIVSEIKQGQIKHTKGSRLIL